MTHTGDSEPPGRSGGPRTTRREKRIVAASMLGGLAIGLGVGLVLDVVALGVSLGPLLGLFAATLRLR